MQSENYGIGVLRLKILNSGGNPSICSLSRKYPILAENPEIGFFD